METTFTPWTSLGGGALIGLAAVLLMALHGRILGATGILSGLLRFDDPEDWRLRAALVVGMAAAAMGIYVAIDLDRQERRHREWLQRYINGK